MGQCQIEVEKFQTVFGNRPNCDFLDAFNVVVHSKLVGLSVFLLLSSTVRSILYCNQGNRMASVNSNRDGSHEKNVVTEKQKQCKHTKFVFIAVHQDTKYLTTNNKEAEKREKKIAHCNSSDTS